MDFWRIWEDSNTSEFIEGTEEIKNMSAQAKIWVWDLTNMKNK
jgi:hypothetical protein